MPLTKYSGVACFINSCGTAACSAHGLKVAVLLRPMESAKSVVIADAVSALLLPPGLTPSVCFICLALSSSLGQQTFSKTMTGHCSVGVTITPWEQALPSALCEFDVNQISFPFGWNISKACAAYCFQIFPWDYIHSLTTAAVLSAVCPPLSVSLHSPTSFSAPLPTSKWLVLRKCRLSKC